VVKREPIECPECGTVVVTDKNTLMYLLLKEDLRCPECGTTVIETTKYSW